MNQHLLAKCALLIVATASLSHVRTADPTFVFRDVAKEVGLRGPLRGMMGRGGVGGRGRRRMDRLVCRHVR